jgi:xanthine dehydrogenase YagR molybdenum-binding subunit
MSTYVVGQPLDRADGRLKVTGAARYSAEVPIPNLVHAVLIQSTIARGRIISIETQTAEAAPGVLAVITYRNAPKLFPSPVGLAERNILAGSAAQSYMPLQDDVIHHSGQHIGVVVAQTLEQATYAASLVQVQYEREQPVVSMQEALPQAFIPKNVWGEPADTLRGNVEQGLAQAEVCVDQTSITTIQHHNTMETHATIAVWEGDTLTLYESSTWVYGVRRAVSFWLNIPEEKIRVIEHFVGGSFGSKGPTWPHVALAAIAAQRVGHPVKLVLTRQQQFTSVGYRPEIYHHIQLGATRDGRLTALVHEATSQTAPFDDRVVAPVTLATQKVYDCPNVATSYRLVHLNMGNPFTMRGPAETPGLFALESAMDELAYALQMDPIDLRLRNYAEVDPENGRPWSSKSLRECYRQGAERFGWARRDPRPRSMRDGDYLVGWGMASMVYDTKFAPTSASAQFFADGTVLVQSATCDQGTGSYTIMRQIAADTLGVPFKQVRFELGDTQMPRAVISAGSMTAASVGSAVQAATTSLRRKILSIALTDPTSPLHNQSEEQVIVENGRCFLREDPTRGETYVDILRRHSMEVAEATEDVKPNPEMKQYTACAFGAHFAEVHVHPDSGEARVRRYVGAFSAGRILNPKTAHSQLIGGIVWGIGMALMEQTILDPHTGRIVNASLGEYHVPVNADVPEIEAFFVEEHDPHVNPLGSKGIGEIGTIGSAAAIANAVYHATGKRVRDLPITLDKLL